MKAMNCDEILMAAMAVSDGEETGLPIAEIKEHIAGCESCGLETAQMELLAQTFANYERREMNADLWPAVSDGIIRSEIARLSGKGVLAVVAVLLVAYKLIELVPYETPGHFLKIAPVIMAVALFIFLKENPFKINTELTMEQ